MTIHIETLVRAAQKSAATTALLLGFILATLSSSAGDDSRDNLKSIKHIIVIYQENWSFDSLYGQFPGADGYANSFDTLPQLDRLAAPPYSSLIYETPSPLTGFPLIPDPQFPSVPKFHPVGGKLALAGNPNLALPLIPYDFTTYIASTSLTGDIVHRFYHEQLQIDSGTPRLASRAALPPH